jgi:hypothetical protein
MGNEKSADYTKIDESHYSFDGRKEFINAQFIVHPIQLSDLKNPEIQNKSGNDFTIVLKLLLFGFIAFIVLAIIFSSHNSNSKQPDYLGSAEEKINKGLPLNSQEQQALDGALGAKNEKDQSKEIEKKHGE